MKRFKQWFLTSFLILGSVISGVAQSQKISQLPSGNPAQSGDLIPVARSGSNYSVTPGSIVSLSNTGVVAANGFGLYNDGQFVLDATITNGQDTISCANSDCNFTTADNGKICFATNLSASVANWQSVVILPQGTLTVTGAQTATCSGGNATQSKTSVFVWGHDDSTALANAFTAAFNSCSTLILPGINSQGTGPAVMLVQQAEFGVTGAGSGFNDCRETPLDTPRGIGVVGQGMTSTWIIPTPNFSAATCTFGATNACFFGTADGQSVQNLTIWGAGNSNPGTAFASVKGASVSCSNWCQMRNVALAGWGSNATNGLTYGLVAKGGLYETLDHVLVDGFGGGNASAEVYVANVTLLACNFLNAGQGQIMEVASSIATPVISFGSQYVNPAAAYNIILMDSGSVFNSYGDVFGPTGTSTAAISVGAGTINISDGYVWSTIASAKAFTLTSGGILRLNNTTANMSGTTTTGITNAGSYFDQGGNTLTATTPYTGAGNVFGSLSITGTAQTAGNIALTNFGSSPSVGTVSGDSRVHQFTVTIGSTPSGTATIVDTFPTPFLIAPICNATPTGGNNSTLGSFTTGTISATSVTFTYVGTLIGADTLIVQVNCF